MLRQAIEQGDWARARSAAEQLAAQPAPEDRDEREERLRQLGEFLKAARAQRAQLAASLARVRAASRFQEAPSGQAGVRQNFVEPMDF